MTCTIFENIFSKEPHFITIDKALERIKNGSSRAKVEEIRNALDKEKSQELKKGLPSVCFSGKFSQRYDTHMIEHSGFIVLDFDNVEVETAMVKYVSSKHTYAAWVSPGGQGIKVLIRIADGKKHREHFAALKETFPEADMSGVNESRVCYESYDPNMFVNTKSEVFTRTLLVEKIQSREIVSNEREIFTKLLKWLSNKRYAFAKGERNSFIFKLASACCRYGISQDSAEYLIVAEYPASNDFTQKEANTTIKSAYKKNGSSFGTAIFDREVLIDKSTRKEIEVQREIDMDAPPQDVIYGAHVKENAFKIHKQGYESVKGVGVLKLDELFKPKRGEGSLMSGIGNMGKSTFRKWYILLRAVLYGEKFASFSPEDNPPEEFYHDFVEMLLGCNCTPFNSDGTVNFENPSDEYYSNAYDFASKHVFYLYPQNSAPTPEYIKERFLEIIIKEKVDGVDIDPFNQMAHDYGGKKDEYLEYVLADFNRFAQVNNVYLMFIAHPNKMQKEANGNYPCPDVFDMAGGAMWNNKMDNILIYHKPFAQSDPSNPSCEFHSKKIRRQKTVGKRGFASFEYVRRTRRFEIDGHDPLSEAMRKNDLQFHKPVSSYKPVEAKPVAEINNPRAGFQTNTTPRPPAEFWNDK